MVSTMDMKDIIKKLNTQIDQKRIEHSINVMEVSESMARHYNVDIQKAKIAGILHDCGKNYVGDEARRYASKIQYKPDRIEMLQPKLLHGIIGRHLAMTMYNIEDDDILNAIRWHTTGRPAMSTLEKIIYIADYIEPLRTFNGIEQMRRLAYEDLDKCIVQCADSTIQYIMQKRILLHEKTVETRNYSLLLVKEKESQKI